MERFSLSIYSYWYQRLGGEILRQNSRLGGQLMGRHDGLMALRGHVVQHHFSWTDMVQSYILNEFHHWLVVWKCLEDVLFSHILKIIIPTDYIIFFRWVEPSKQNMYELLTCPGDRSGGSSGGRGDCGLSAVDFYRGFDTAIAHSILWQNTIAYSRCINCSDQSDPCVPTDQRRVTNLRLT